MLSWVPLALEFAFVFYEASAWTAVSGANYVDECIWAGEPKRAPCSDPFKATGGESLGEATGAGVDAIGPVAGDWAHGHIGAAGTGVRVEAAVADVVVSVFVFMMTISAEIVVSLAAVSIVR